MQCGASKTTEMIHSLHPKEERHMALSWVKSVIYACLHSYIAIMQNGRNCLLDTTLSSTLTLLPFLAALLRSCSCRVAQLNCFASNAHPTTFPSQMQALLAQSMRVGWNQRIWAIHMTILYWPPSFITTSG